MISNNGKHQSGGKFRRKILQRDSFDGVFISFAISMANEKV